MEDKRRFSRISCSEKIIVLFKKDIIEATLLDISLKGAFIEFNNDMRMKEGDKIQIDFPLEDSDVVLQFGAEVKHSRNNYIGVKFVFIDYDTFVHLRNFLDVRSRNPQLVSEELMNIVM